MRAKPSELRNDEIQGTETRRLVGHYLFRFRFLAECVNISQQQMYSKRSLYEMEMF